MKIEYIINIPRDKVNCGKLKLVQNGIKFYIKILSGINT